MSKYLRQPSLLERLWALLSGKVACQHVTLRENMDAPEVCEEVFQFIREHSGTDVVDIASELGLTLRRAEEITDELMISSLINPVTEISG